MPLPKIFPLKPPCLELLSLNTTSCGLENPIAQLEPAVIAHCFGMRGGRRVAESLVAVWAQFSSSRNTDMLSTGFNHRKPSSCELLWRQLVSHPQQSIPTVQGLAQPQWERVTCAPLYWQSNERTAAQGGLQMCSTEQSGVVKRMSSKVVLALKIRKQFIYNALHMVCFLNPCSQLVICRYMTDRK